MKIIDALKTNNLRLSDGLKWLWYDDMTKEWVVSTRQYNKHKNTELIRTTNEDDAVAILIDEK